jgi:hypothetical protein
MARERTRPRPGKGAARLSPGREAWLVIAGMEVYSYFEVDNDPGERRHLCIRRQYAMSVPLDAMTAQELQMFSDFVVRACANAMPDAIAADENAKKSLEEGDDTVLRNYRMDPKLYYRSPTRPDREEQDAYNSAGDNQVDQSND